MTVQSGELCAQKIPTLFTTVSTAQRSLRAVYAFFPLFAVKALSVPALLMLVMSTLLLVWHGKYADKRINLLYINRFWLVMGVTYILEI